MLAIAGAAVRAVLVVLGMIFIGVFVWTLSDPSIPIIWTGAVFIGLYLLYKGATLRPKVMTARETQPTTMNYGLHNGRQHRRRSIDQNPRMTSYKNANTQEVRPAYQKDGQGCVKCGEPIEKGWLACPFCGTDYREVCRSCGGKIERDWIACPYCSSEL